MTPEPPLHEHLGPVAFSAITIDGMVHDIRRHLSSPERRGATYTYINAHVFNLCWHDDELRSRINSSDLVGADGMAIVWAARALGIDIAERCNILEAFRAFLAEDDMPPSTAILIGGTDAEVERAARTIEADGAHLTITTAVSGYLELGDYADLLDDTDATDLVLIGAGSPKSEAIVDLAHQRWPNALVWHIGGGTVMYYAGSMVEAPAWMRRTGLQWVHRLVSEPRRMWRRYLVGNPTFVARIARIRLGLARSSPMN